MLRRRPWNLILNSFYLHLGTSPGIYLSVITTTTTTMDTANLIRYIIQTNPMQIYRTYLPFDVWKLRSLWGKWNTSKSRFVGTNLGASAKPSTPSDLAIPDLGKMGPIKTNVVIWWKVGLQWCSCKCIWQGWSFRRYVSMLKKTPKMEETRRNQEFHTQQFSIYQRDSNPAISGFQTPQNIHGCCHSELNFIFYPNKGYIKLRWTNV